MTIEPVTFDHAGRRRRFDAVMTEAGVDAVWLPIGADLEYLTGIHRRVPTFGEVNYTHGWASGAFLARGATPSSSCPAWSPSSTSRPASPARSSP